MKALVTGGTGFVGAAMVRVLLEHGREVRALARSASQLDNLRGLPVEISQGDLSDDGSLRTALAGCDELYHAAAHYSLWERDPSIFYRVNVEGTVRLLQLAKTLGITRIVYTSSVATLKPAANKTPVNEEARATLQEVVGHYKRSKLLAEGEVLKLAAAGLPVVIVNPSAPVGPYDIKPTPTGKIILDFLQGKMPGYLDTGLNLVAVEDVAQGHWLAAQRGRVGERYILANENLTLLEILQLLAEITGQRAPWLKVPYSVAYLSGVFSQAISAFTGKPPAVPLDGVRMARKYMFFDASKAREELGFRPTPVKDALARAVTWFQQKGYVR